MTPEMFLWFGLLLGFIVGGFTFFGVGIVVGRLIWRRT